MSEKNKSVNLPKIAILGRVNVGKSTLFNRLIEENKALVSSIPGTTRDIQSGNCQWSGFNFTLIDTGGLFETPEKEEINKKNLFGEAIHKQATKAFTESDIILFIVDAKTGLLPDDKKIAKLLYKTKKPIILVCNKADNPRLREKCQKEDWKKLALGEPLPISAANGSGTGDLLDQVVATIKKLKFKKTDIGKIKTIKIAFIGKPNVGKSSLLNAILGEERVITSPIPHTTREPQDILFTYKDQNFLLVDTAGIRKKAKVEAGLERMGVRRSIKSLDKADIAFFITDAAERLGSQESHLGKLLSNYGVGVIIVANKWDLIANKETDVVDKFADYYYAKLPHLSWAPIIFISAKTGQRVKKILDLAREVQKEREKEISDKALEKFLKTIIKKHPPTRGGGALVRTGKKTRHPYIYHLKQIGIKPPKFEIKISPKVKLGESYVRFIEKQLRKKFGFAGTPLHLVVRSKNYSH